MNGTGERDMKRCDTVKALGMLLTYPSEDLVAARTDIQQVITGEGLLSRPVLAQVGALVRALGDTDLYDLQERYIQLFDRSRTLSLHLYEHVHGESRERGPAMVNLREIYRSYGFEIDSRELPDFLPMLCEFLSQVPETTAREILGEARVVLDALCVRLEERASPYAGVLAALAELTGAPADATAVAAHIKAEGEDDDADDLEAMDRIWEEASVAFGAGDALAGACPLVQPPQA